MSTRSIGGKAENMAVNYLKKLGYRVLERNYQIRGGEIDIVAREENSLVFVEVKARWNHEYGSPIESISYFKLRALQKAALFYINKVGWGDRPYRFDLLGIDFTNSRDNPEFEIIKNITA